MSDGRPSQTDPLREATRLLQQSTQELQTKLDELKAEDEVRARRRLRRPAVGRRTSRLLHLHLVSDQNREVRS